MAFGQLVVQKQDMPDMTQKGSGYRNWSHLDKAPVRVDRQNAAVEHRSSSVIPCKDCEWLDKENFVRVDRQQLVIVDRLPDGNCCNNSADVQNVDKDASDQNNYLTGILASVKETINSIK